MKKFMAVAVVMCAVAAAPAAQAAGTATLNVSANVLGSCVFTNDVGNLVFGDLDPASPGDVFGTSNAIEFWCSNGTTYTITDDDGLNETGPNNLRLGSTTLTPAEFIPYTISYTATGVGLGASTPIVLQIDGTILNADFAGRAADLYTDTVTITLNP